MIHRTPASQAWIATPYAGIQMCVLRKLEGSSGGSILMKFPAGSRFPTHDHPGGEEIYVLKGKLTIGRVTLSAGDYLWTPPGGVHDAKAEEETLLFVTSSEGIRILD